MGSEQDSGLIAALYDLSSKAPKLVKSSTYPAPADEGIKVRSWRMNEFKYYDVPSPFPTLARGLFTVDNPQGDKFKHQIVARGYDKFFNIGEVPWTTWPTLEKYTSPPYTLTLKSNGCIIFIAALTPDKLLVTSKHSLGPVVGVNESHAQVGQRWLQKHLKARGKTEEELAKVLWDDNLTAIAELCDDSFEEHVLGYAADKTGLHLHGLNRRSKDFITLPPTAVDTFAEEWGFIKTPYTVLDNIPAVHAFTDEIGRTGSWNGEPLEGFVVRSQVSAPRNSTDDGRGAPPYPPGSSFFFKVKFDEPYMMYRDWREVTKKLLSTKESMDSVRIPKSKLKRAETKLYLSWVKAEIKRDQKMFEGFTKGRGIIATRERFLEWCKGDEGKKGLMEAKKEEAEGDTVTSSQKEFGKTIIAPIAIPGCGKTTVSVALAHLFGFGHTQSDDVKAKKAAPVFIKNVQALLKKHDVVIADKNNHLRQHRQQLRDASSSLSPPVRLLALNWSLDKPHATLHRVCGDRILLRGANHQSLPADTTGRKAHEDVLWMFITQSEELEDSEVDASVDIDVEGSLETMLSTAVDACVRVLGLSRPSETQIRDALNVARAYAPKTRKTIENNQKAPQTPRYFALLPELDLGEVLEDHLAHAEDKRAKAFWERLKDNKRVTARPHVTIVHSKSLPAEVGTWEQCTTVQRTNVPPLFEFGLGSVVWNDRIMAVTVEDISAIGSSNPTGNQASAEFVSQLPEEIRGRLHITVGTRDGNVLAVEAKALVERWRRDGTVENGGAIELEGVKGYGRIKGMFT